MKELRLLLVSIYWLLAVILSLLSKVTCDPHHPHLGHNSHQPANMTELCNRHKWFIGINHYQHIAELKYRTCMSQVSMAKFKRQFECFTIMDPNDIGYCMATENYQPKFEELKKCLDETMPSDEEAPKLMECMGFRAKPKERRKRDIRWFITRMSNLSQVCDVTLIGYYLNHPSHSDAHHTCTIDIIGNERVAQRVACHSKYPIKSYNDFNKKCKENPEEYDDEFKAGMECFQKNQVTPGEKAAIMVCTFKALTELDKEYALQALIYKPFATFDEFCIKSRNYWHDDEEIYKDRFDACSMKVNRVKTEQRWVCETFDKFDQTSVDKCIEKQENEFNQMMTCLGQNEYTSEEEEKIKVCLSESQVEWKGIPKMASTMEEACVYTLFRWFGYNPVYYKFVAECMKEKWTPEQYAAFECADILTIKTKEELSTACANPTEEQRNSYLKFRECREKNEPPLEKIREAFECSMAKMIDHVNDIKKESADEEEDTSDGD